MPEVYAQLPLTVQTKQCTRCQQDKPLDAFAKHARIKSGRRSYCRACGSEIERERRIENPEALRALDKARYERDKDKRLAACAEYRNRPEIKKHTKTYQRSYLERNRERKYAISARWALKHPECRSVSTQRRRSREHSSAGRFTTAQWRALKALYDHRCLRCGQQEPDIKIEPDHVVPIAHGGRNDINNIQPLCARCNRTKWARTVDYRGGAFAALILNRKREQFGYEHIAKSIAEVLWTGRTRRKGESGAIR